MVLPAEIPNLIGIDGIAELFQVPRNTAYSWAARGRLGKADAKLSTRAMWHADRFPEHPDPTRLDLIDKGRRPPISVVLLGQMELAEAFRVQLATIEAWRRRARDLPAGDPLKTPDPRFEISVTPIWVAEDWKPYAVARRRWYDPPTLAAWHKQQKAVR